MNDPEVSTFTEQIMSNEQKILNYGNRDAQQSIVTINH